MEPAIWPPQNFSIPAANNFNAAGSLGTARSKHSAFLLPNNNEVLVVGGQSAGNDLASAELYIPWQKAFQTTGVMATPRSGATGAALTKVDGRLLIAGGSSASAELYGFATVKTDAADYPPGSIVTITGTGWQPGETVTLSMVESPLIDTHPTMTAVADAFGNISNNQFSPDVHDVDVRFYLTATGSQSQAQNTFTDANPGTLSIGTPNPVSILPGGQDMYDVTETFTGNSTSCTVGLSAAPTASPAWPSSGVSFSFTQNGNPVTSLTSTGATQSATLTISTPATMAPNTYNFTVTTTRTSGCQNNPQTLTANGNLVVHGPATQIRIETAADGSGNVVGNTTVAPNSSITVYAIERDSGNRLVTNAAAAWSLTTLNPPFGGVVSTDLVPSGDSKSAAFTGHLAGSAKIQAIADSFTGTSGTITVTSGGNTTPSFLTSPITAAAGQCAGPITIQTSNANKQVNLSTSSSGGTFYSNSGCTTTVTSVMTGNNPNNASFFYKDTNTGTPTIWATAADSANTASQQETITGGTANAGHLDGERQSHFRGR